MVLTVVSVAPEGAGTADAATIGEGGSFDPFRQVVGPSRSPLPPVAATHRRRSPLALNWQPGGAKRPIAVPPRVGFTVAWKARTGGDGQLFRPLRAGKPGHPARFIQEHTLLNHLAAALEKRDLPRITWYQATRHTFASQWVLNDGSIEKLASTGHSSTWVTERYAHLRPDLFKERDLAILDVSGTRSGTIGHSLGTGSEKLILESTNSPSN